MSSHVLDGRIVSKRKTRKGTQSCWECRRRKVKCSLGDTRPTVNATTRCTACQQRGSRCVTQDEPDPHDAFSPPVNDSRLARVESRLTELLGRIEVPQSSDVEAETARENSTDDDNNPGSAERHAADHAWSTPSAITDIPLRASPALPDDHVSLSNALFSALPSKEVLDLIFTTPRQTPTCLNGLCQDSLQDSAGSSTPWQLPSSPDMHPVLMAKNLLIFSCYLQANDKHPLNASDLCGHEISTRLVGLVHDLVLCKDHFAHSVDGIECRLMESMYHNNAGDLRKAWFSSRQALTTAQMLRLHKNSRQITANPKARHLWSRLIQSDRYLSLMLGLPQAAPGDHLTMCPSGAAPLTATDRLQWLDTLAAGRMLQRTDSEMRSNQMTREIDSILQDAAVSLPPKWWLVPATPEGDDPEFGNNALRLMHQFAHYHLVARLHLPYLLNDFNDVVHEQCRTIAINASREILTRYVSLRRSEMTMNYCRGVDFLMFIACVIICLAHILHAYQLRPPYSSISFNPLAHLRLTDRGLMECACEFMRVGQRRQDDLIEGRIRNLLHHLLKVEADAASGLMSTSTLTTKDRDRECEGEMDDSGTSLKIVIPWIGALTIERRPELRVNFDMQASDITTAECSSLSTLQPNVGFQASHGWPLQGVDAALFQDIFADFETSIF